MRVNWNDYESMHWDAAVALGVSRHHLYTLHHLPFLPLILQMQELKPSLDTDTMT